MHVWVPSYQGHNCEVRPLRRRMVKGVERDQKGKSPELEDDSSCDTAVDDLTCEGHCKQQAHSQE